MLLPISTASNGYHSTSNGRNTRYVPHQQVSDYKSRFCGHCNTHTDIKEAIFIGDRGNFVAAGSDDGNIFIWERATGNLVRVLKGDSSIVNCIQWNPATPIMATSGIENVVRIWEPRMELDVDPELGPNSKLKLAPSHRHRHRSQGQRAAVAEEGEEEEEESSRVVSDLVKVCKDNQHRMGIDPFEVMLMRMGFRLAMADEGAAAAYQPQQRGGGGAGGGAGGGGGGGGEGQEPMEDAGEVRWINNPSNCRQS